MSRDNKIILRHYTAVLLPICIIRVDKLKDLASKQHDTVQSLGLKQQKQHQKGKQSCCLRELSAIDHLNVK